MTTAERNRRKTHCPMGHAYDYQTPDGRRRGCRRCRRAQVLAFRTKWRERAELVYRQATR